MKKIIIATGGTGGHIYPAVALGKQLENHLPLENLLFVGGALNTNRFFDRRFPYQSISCGSFVRKNPLALFNSLNQIGKGIAQSLKIFKKFRPALVVAFGSYYTFPLLTAAKLASIPFVLHEANSMPGKVNRLFSGSALLTGIHFPSAADRLKGNTQPVGMPLRENFKRLSSSKEMACAYFNLSQNVPTLLIFGGSQGAKILNTPRAIEQWPSPLQILHFTGDSTLVPVLEASYKSMGIRCLVKAYENRMDLAWQAADFMISRAGASTIAEQLEFEVPGLLIPYRYAADNHQEHNADFMCDQIGGGIKLLEREIDPIVFADKIKQVILQADQMRLSMKNYKKQTKNRDFFEIIKEFLERV